jgi:hypothetical protein
MARHLGTTRSAAALSLWKERLEGAVVAIGNAPTALFHLLEIIAAGGPKPALVLGFPVGFVGAAESKDALADNPFGVPFLAIRGRRGGSAMAAAAVNALAAGLPEEATDMADETPKKGLEVGGRQEPLRSRGFLSRPGGCCTIRQDERQIPRNITAHAVPARYRRRRMTRPRDLADKPRIRPYSLETNDLRTPPWLTLIGIGEDGVLAPGGAEALRQAEIVYGGARHSRACRAGLRRKADLAEPVLRRLTRT